MVASSLGWPIPSLLLLSARSRSKACTRHSRHAVAIACAHEHLAMEIIFGSHDLVDFLGIDNFAHLGIICLLELCQFYVQGCDLSQQLGILCAAGICVKLLTFQPHHLAVEFHLLSLHFQIDGEQFVCLSLRQSSLVTNVVAHHCLELFRIEVTLLILVALLLCHGWKSNQQRKDK